jgi:NitT/TauT family transport system substrate-binding protein
MASEIDRRALLGGGMATGLGLLAGCRSRTGNGARIRFLTNWFAQAEHGGFYQALAGGHYARSGLDVEIAMGGPQINSLQLLTAGRADIIIGYDIQVLKAVEQGLPVVTVAASFQRDLQGLMTHRDIASLAQLRGHKMLIATNARATFWPWLVQHYGFRNEDAAPYTFNLQPFLVDPRAAVQAYPSSEPFEAARANVPAKFFLLADEGYPPYGTTIITTREFIQRRPEAVQAFVRASMQGWREYLARPALADIRIRAANPVMSQAQLDYALAYLRRIRVLDADLPSGASIGSMTAERWRRTRDFMVAGGTLSPDTDWTRAFTTRFVDNLGIHMEDHA